MIEALRLHNIRNIQAADITLANRLNIFVGKNGSGKTSLLEALHVLSRAKSFRTATLRPVVQQGAAGFTIFAKLVEQNRFDDFPNAAHRLGLAFDSREGKSARLDGETVKSTSELARHLPVTYLGPETLNLLGAPPEERRNFLDWGLFHVEQSFLPLVQRYGRAIKQRNAALKKKAPSLQVSLWDRELAETGTALTALRLTYIQQLWPLFIATLSHMSPEFRWGNDITWRYTRGWPEDIELQTSLNTSYETDKNVGFTRCGPHRADVVLLGDQRPLRDQVSAGQSKVLVCALLHAQAKLVENVTGLCPVVLVDDLPSELDKQHRSSVLDALGALNTQFVVTATEQNLLSLDNLGSADQMFHVEHGTITELSSSTARFRCA